MTFLGVREDAESAGIHPCVLQILRLTILSVLIFLLVPTTVYLVLCQWVKIRSAYQAAGEMVLTMDPVLVLQLLLVLLHGVFLILSLIVEDLGA